MEGIAPENRYHCLAVCPPGQFNPTRLAIAPLQNSANLSSVAGRLGSALRTPCSAAESERHRIEKTPGKCARSPFHLRECRPWRDRGRLKAKASTKSKRPFLRRLQTKKDVRVQLWSCPLKAVRRPGLIVFQVGGSAMAGIRENSKENVSKLCQPEVLQGQPSRRSAFSRSHEDGHRSPISCGRFCRRPGIAEASGPHSRAANNDNQCQRAMQQFRPE